MESLRGGKLVNLPDKAKEALTSGSKDYTPAELGLRKEPGFASQCIGCGKCEEHCPQHINIREKLKEADHGLRPLPYKIGIRAVRKIMIAK